MRTETSTESGRESKQMTHHGVFGDLAELRRHLRRVDVHTQPPAAPAAAPGPVAGVGPDPSQLAAAPATTHHNTTPCVRHITIAIVV